MNYSELSDFEINKLVAMATGHKCYYDDGSYTNDGINVTVKGNGRIGWFNPCREADTAWPIILANDIGFEKQIQECCDHCKEYYITDYWEASHALENIHTINKNPLRAAMIVFLIMQEEKRG